MRVGNAASSTVSIERKSYTYTDYSDESYPVTITSVAGNNVTLASVAGINVGDVLWQSSSLFGQITAINVGLSQVTLLNSVSFSSGAASILPGYPVTITWLPKTSERDLESPMRNSNAGFLKQFSEGTLVFKQATFTSAVLNYSSDIDGSLSGLALSGSSPLGWGYFVWGNSVWGGTSGSSVMRHYIPRNKQRCSMLVPSFTMQQAWSSFLLEGLSLQFNQISSRGSR